MAREGDINARNALIERYYQDWVDKFHGQLGKTIRRLYDTNDLVQSAVGDALRALPTLRNEGVFFTWVTSIIRHKIAAQKRRLKREEPLTESKESALPDSDFGLKAGVIDQNEIYLRTLDAILALYPDHPEEMTAVVLKLLDDRPVQVITEFMNASERTVFRRLRDGTALLRNKVDA